MAQPITYWHEKISLSPPDSTNSSQVVRILQTPRVELLHVVLRVGEDIPTHEPQGETIVHCLTGRVELRAHDAFSELLAGQIQVLRGNQPFSIRAHELSSLLLTILEPRTGHPVSLIGQTPDHPR